MSFEFYICRIIHNHTRVLLGVAWVGFEDQFLQRKREEEISKKAKYFIHDLLITMNSYL